MKIAHFLFHTCPLAAKEGKETGGANVYVLELSKELARQGITVDMYTRCQHPDNPEMVAVAPRLRLIHLPAGPDNADKKELIRYVDDYAQRWLGFTAQHQLKYDLLHAHYYLAGMIGERIRQKIGPLPLVMSFHTLALLKNLVARTEKEKEEDARIRAENGLVKKADRIIVPGASERDYLKYLYQAPAAKLSVIPPGVDTGLFRPAAQKKAKSHIRASGPEKIILFVGRVEPLKGLDTLLYALKILTAQNPRLKIALWIVGGDTSLPGSDWPAELKKLKHIEKTLELSIPIHFSGRQPQSKLPDYYNAAEVVVMPSHYESFGMVALEAMACGVPVITTDVTGVAATFDRHRPEIISSVNNPLLLASQIGHLITRPAVRRRIGTDLQRQAAQYDWEKITTRILDIYQSASSCYNKPC